MSDAKQRAFRERVEKGIENLEQFLFQLKMAVYDDDPSEMEMKKIVVEECAENLIGLVEQRINELENNESERDGWFSWPSTTPPDDEECIVTFTEDGHARTLIGRYHSEFDLWVFPTLDKRVGTITTNDKAFSAVLYKPLEP